jgi:hypothetical protein
VPLAICQSRVACFVAPFFELHCQEASIGRRCDCPWPVLSTGRIADDLASRLQIRLSVAFRPDPYLQMLVTEGPAGQRGPQLHGGGYCSGSRLDRWEMTKSHW